jgi:hypothetical protein
MALDLKAVTEYLVVLSFRLAGDCLMPGESAIRYAVNTRRTLGSRLAFNQERHMRANTIRKVFSMGICVTLLVLGPQAGPVDAYQDQSGSAPPPNSAPPPDTSAQSSSDSSGQSSSDSSSTAPVAASLGADQLDALVAPIALYPDNLVAQILAAATFPDQVAVADYWVQQNKSLTGAALGTAVDQ